MILSGFVILLFSSFEFAYAEDDLVKVTIVDPFVELHTGPGGGYPIFHIISRGAQVTVLRQRTDWIKIIDSNGKSGWVSRVQMENTELPGGEKLPLHESSQSDFVKRQWIAGAATGEFEDAPIFSLFGAYSFTENISAEASYGRSIGNVSSSTLLKLNLVMQPFPTATYSPYFTLGTGTIKVKPSAVLIALNRRENDFSQIGIGVQHYLNKRFIFRLEYNEYIIYSATNVKDENEDINEWKVGFAVFF